MRIVLLFLGFLIAWPTGLWADTVYLKDGKVITGKVREKGSYYIILDVNGVPHKYFNDQIINIEEDKQGPSTVKIIPSPQLNAVAQNKQGLILELVKINGTYQGIDKNLNSLINLVPGVTKARYEKLFDTNEIISRLIPIYDKYFSESDLVELIRFYQTPVGRKMTEVSGKIQAEALEESVKYFDEKFKQNKSKLLTPSP